MKPYLLTDRCPAIEDVCLAMPACPLDAIAYEKDEAEPLGGRIVFDLEACDGCGKCAEECCGKAIEMR